MDYSEPTHVHKKITHETMFLLKTNLNLSNKKAKEMGQILHHGSTTPGLIEKNFCHALVEQNHVMQPFFEALRFAIVKH